MALTTERASQTFGVNVDFEAEANLAREFEIPVLSGAQRQGDVLIVPTGDAKAVETEVEGRADVVRGEAGGNTHSLHGLGTIYWESNPNVGVSDLRLGTLTVPPGSEAYLMHREHGGVGIAPGTYDLRRQREQAEEQRMVAD